ncbi:hypothetical protein ACFODZ_11595 [Marinicella sediminis]|uniref:Acetone carboxylase subunit gamma n=1 Tax=Marinicella sediminis TaxID=1792834 RepID=A0ABV7J9T8_9GAMM
MSSIRCDCGERIFLGQIPNPHQWKFISDDDLDKYSGMINIDEMYIEMSSFIKCPSCGSLWVFWNGWNSKPQKFVPSENNETETPGHI